MTTPAPKLNILRVITWLPIGGIERRLVAVLPRLDRERFNVSLVCIRERGQLADELEAAGVPVEVIPFKSRWDPSALRRLAAYMRSNKIDVVHSHMYRSNVPATVAARMAGVKTVWCQVHNVGTWETRRQAWMDRALCRWRTGMIAVSERVRRDVMDTLGLSAGRVRVIYNGVDIDRFRAARALRDEIRTREGVQPGDVVFLFAARLVEQKRCIDFLIALGKLQSMRLSTQDSGLRTNLFAWILGDGPLREQLEQASASLPQPGAVRFFGKRSDVEQFMAGSDVFVLPSTREGFSNALIEALASGLPCIATDVGGNAEAVRDQREGFIIPPLDVERLTGAMASLARDPELRRALAEAASLRAERFSIERMITEIENIYARGLRTGG
ncbi:glycosyltransferase [bacterium]|nr:glycosyltransferase [bacterium]